MEAKIIRMPALEQKVGLKKSAIYKRIKEYDFPKPVRFGSHATGWLESDINDWLLKLAGKLPTNDVPAQHQPAPQPLAGPHLLAGTSHLAEMLKAPLGTELLRPDEIAKITGHKAGPDQAKWLADNRWRFHTNGNGEVIIGRMYARLRMCGIDPVIYAPRSA